MNKKRWWALGIFLCIAIIYLASANGSRNKEGQANAWGNYLQAVEQPWTTQIYKEGSGQTIALIKIEGVISESEASSPAISTAYNHQVFLQQIEDAFTDQNIKAIILQINSPGGGVYESDEAYHRLMELKAQYKKPLLVYMSQEAASGAYYISMAADKIYANQNTLTGSIGVIISTYNYSQLANKVGIQDVTFKSGANKDMLNPMRPLSEAEKTIMQELVNDSYGRFVDVVVQGRQMDRQKVLELADGRIYSGNQAQQLKLVDDLGYLDDTIEGAALLAHTSDPQVLLYENPAPNILDWLMSVKAPTLDLLGFKEQLNQERGPELMYISN